MGKGMYERIMTATKLMVDPPSGWMYGFPALWDKEKQPELKEFLKEKGYPEKDIDFALNHIRMWFPQEKQDGANV